LIAGDGTAANSTPGDKEGPGGAEICLGKPGGGKIAGRDGGGHFLGVRAGRRIIQGDGGGGGTRAPPEGGETEWAGAPKLGGGGWGWAGIALLKKVRWEPRKRGG